MKTRPFAVGIALICGVCENVTAYGPADWDRFRLADLRCGRCQHVGWMHLFRVVTLSRPRESESK